MPTHKIKNTCCQIHKYEVMLVYSNAQNTVTGDDNQSSTALVATPHVPGRQSHCALFFLLI